MKSANTLRLLVASGRRRGKNIRRAELLYSEAKRYFTKGCALRDGREYKRERRRLVRRVEVFKDE